MASPTSYGVFPLHGEVVHEPTATAKGLMISGMSLIGFAAGLMMSSFLNTSDDYALYAAPHMTPSSMRPAMHTTQPFNNAPQTVMWAQAPPKKPLTAYFQFMKEQRPVFVAKNPKASVTEVAQGLGQQWKSLSDVQKTRYQDIVAKDKERYEREMASYVPDPNAVAAPKKAASRAKKDPNAPKKGRSAYLLFGMDARNQLKKEGSTLSATEIMQELGRRWKMASPATKAEYEEMAKRDKVRYETELAEYNKGK